MPTEQQTLASSASSSDNKPRPRVFYGWYIVAASVLSNMVTSGTYWQGFQVFFLPLVQEFGWSRAALSGAFSMRQVEIGVAAPLVGFLVDRFGPRKVILVSSFLIGGGIFLCSFTSNLLTFYLFFFMASAGASGTSHAVSWSVTISRWFRRKRGVAIGIGTSGPVLGGIILLGLSWLVDSVGWRDAMKIAGLAVLVIVTPFSMVVRDYPSDMGLRPDGDTRAPEHSTSAQLSQVARDEQTFTVGEALRSREFWIATLYFTLLFFGSSAVQVHQVPMFQNDMGFTLVEATTTLGMVFFVSGIGRIGGGFLADLLDIRIVLAIMASAMALGYLYLLVVPITSFGLAIPFALIFGIPFGATVSVRPVLMAKLFGSRSLGSVIGWFQAAALGSGVIGPVIMGYYFDLEQTYHSSLVLFFVVTLLALPPLLWLKPARPSEVEIQY